ncbi:MAG: hypothetical protein NTW47_01545, partial [Proteobacteria bacterium]|nr:hypothetical protein [Pseudomonadota bacterium]
MRQVPLIILALFIPAVALAFNVEGFTTGMQKSSVTAVAGKAYKLVTVDDGTIVANGPNGAYLSFNFCEDRLVAVQQGFQPNLKQVSLIISEFKGKYGNPISTNAGTRAHSSGTIYEWGMWWGADQEYVSLYFMGSEQGDSLSTS